MADQKRILLVTRNLPPLIGGMERLNWNMLKELSLHHAVSAIGPTSSKSLAPKSVLFHPVPLSPLWRFLVYALYCTTRLAIKWRPAIVIAGSGLTAPAVWIAARLSGADAVAYLHGLDITVENQIYRWLWLPFIRRMDRIIVNSRSTASLAVRAGISKEKIGIVHPGVDLPRASRQDNGKTFRLKYGLGDAPILLSVGRLTERKGIREFVSTILPEVARRHPDVQLLVIGGESENALAARTQSKASIRAAAMKAGVIANVRFLGRVSDEELSEAFSAASAHVFPVRELPGDPEGFGMVAIEAAAHGLPTVAFACGGIPDAVEQGVSGWLVNPGDHSAFLKKLTELISIEKGENWREGCLQFAHGKAWPAFRSHLERELELAATTIESQH